MAVSAERPPRHEGDYHLLPLSRFKGSSPDHDSTVDEQSSIPKEPAQGYPLRRFILRTSLLVIIPPLITAYFAVVCWVYQIPDPEKNRYGHRNASWVYYSWFVIGVFGLGISKYGLTGIEAAMLQDRHWHTRDTMALLMHSGQSWSGIGGWMKCLGILLRKKKCPAQRLWWLLGFLSLVITVALPLSGLSMELFDGFVQASDKPLVIGYFPETFNNKNDFQTTDRGRLRWQVASSINLPGAGVAYTPRGLDRSQYKYLTELPNWLSADQDVPDLFLIPQAKNPVSGSAWGLRLSYNCSTVQSMSELTILPKKNSLQAHGTIDSTTDDAKLGQGPYGSDVVSVFNTTVNNLFSYVELGAFSNISYYDYGANPKPDILEYVMWQVRVYKLIEGGPDFKYPFNNTISTPILDMGSPLVQNGNGTFSPNATFLEIPQGKSYKADPDALHHFVADGRSAYDSMFAELAPPMGVRCQCLSEPGTAKINPDDLSFDEFVRVSPEDPDPFEDMGQTLRQSTKPFGHKLWNNLHNHKTGFSDLLGSINMPPAPVFENREEYTHYFQPHDLRKSLMRAYAIDALQLMYDGIDTFENAHVAENLTASKPGKILGPGTVPPHISAVLFGIWSLGCIILGLQYGFRRRWAETLDGYSFLRFGADHAEEIRNWPDILGNNSEFYENSNLVNLPGLVGDSKVDQDVGHISLVEKGNYTRRNKLYN